jgi:DNA-3-methyladenine glycosylase
MKHIASNSKNILRVLDQSFYDSLTAPELAKNLLGKIIVTEIDNQLTSGRIVETEAYLQNDPAAHSFVGKTERNKSMYGPAGHAYVYFTYGMHYCVNVVSKKDGEGVLLRALEPVEGIEVMKLRRKITDIYNLCSGPAKLTKSMGIDRRLDGYPLFSSPIYIIDDGYRTQEITTTTRVGITKAKEELLRFYITGSKFISRP